MLLIMYYFECPYFLLNMNNGITKSSSVTTM